jgi:hypothetical protein
MVRLFVVLLPYGHLTNRRTTTDHSEVAALKLLQHPWPVALNVLESLFRELKYYEI